MPQLYSAAQLGISAPSGGFQNGGWYQGRQYYNGMLGDANVITNPNQTGYGQGVSAEVRKQSAAAQGVSPEQFDSYLKEQGATQMPNTDYSSWAPSGSAGGGGGGGIGYAAPAAPIDLMAEYDKLQGSAGIKAIQDKLTAAAESFNKAQSQINDNPFLSESNRVGRVQKLQTDYNNNTLTMQNSLKLAQADADARMTLTEKQYDLNNQATQQALTQFNSLLESGALSGASVDDIAGIAKSTGMSTSMIQSAIKSNNDKNVQTATISFDDGKNQGFAIINSKTGAIISKQVVAASAPSSKASGGSSGGSAAEQKQQAMQAIQEDIKGKWTLGALLSAYTGYFTPQQIYQMYNTSSPWGPVKASSEQLKQYGIKA
jgi:hypothetical protein